MAECWCGADAPYWNQSTCATEASPVCGEHTKDGFMTIAKTRFVVHCEVQDSGSPMPYDAAVRLLKRIEKLGACKERHSVLPSIDV
jgi:hypothetical protein